MSTRTCFLLTQLSNMGLMVHRSDFPLKKMCFERIEMLNGIQDPMVNTNNNFNSNHRPLQSLSPTPAADPYAFSDESSATPAGTPMSRSMRNSRDDIFQRPSPYKVSRWCKRQCFDYINEWVWCFIFIHKCKQFSYSIFIWVNSTLPCKDNLLFIFITIHRE